MGERSNKRTIKAIVVSNKMDKTIVVRAQRLVKHPVFHKYVRSYVKFKALMRKTHATWAIRF